MKRAKSLVALGTLATAFCQAVPAGVQPVQERTHYSDTFGEWRHYQAILPENYATSGKYYPVIYYFHGHSGRYKGEQYGNGQVFLPEIIAYVQKHDVIVIRWDGYVEKDYDDFYGGSPYDIMGLDGEMDFGKYFQELVSHVDNSYRTVADRQHRATSGLSMGGFMSLYISARFPHLVGSASAFNPGHEFWTGPKGARVLYRLSHHVLNHGYSRVRLVKASGDYIGQYHDLLREVYARAPEVDFEFRQDEYDRHWVTSIEETFDFHQRAFGSAELLAHPRRFSHDNAYSDFSVWGYEVQVENKRSGFVCLRDVDRGYFRVFTRQFAPDGPPVEDQTVRIRTPGYYGNSKDYQILDYSHREDRVRHFTLQSSEEGELLFELDGLGHDIAILNGRESRAPVLLPLSTAEVPVVFPDTDVQLPIRLLNSLDVPAENVTVTLVSEYPTVVLQGGPVSIDRLGPGEIVDLTERFQQRFASTEGPLQHCRLNLQIGYRGWYSDTRRIDVQVAPSPLEEPAGLEILDGRKRTFRIFRQAGNQGGGFLLEREVQEGTGNGDGRADPGENITLWVRTRQGLDPADKNSWHRTKVFATDPCVVGTSDIAEPKEREWTSVKDHTSLLELAPDCPAGHQIDLILKNESYSFVWQPDTRYGRELLYQAIQRHRTHVHRHSLTVGGTR